MAERITGLVVAALLAVGCGGGGGDGPGGDATSGAGDAAESAGGAAAEPDVAASEDVDGGPEPEPSTPARGWCTGTPPECGPGEVVWEGTREDGVACAVCGPDRSLCAAEEVPDGDGGCVALGVPCALGTLDAEGRCVRAEPDCAEGETLVGGTCVVLGPSWSCPPDEQVFPDMPSTAGAALHVLAGAPADGADGSAEHPYPTLAAAFAIAWSGVAVLVGDGDYGPGALTTDNVTVRGLCPERTRVTGAGTQAAIAVTGAAGVVVEDLEVQGPWRGVHLTNTTGAVVRRVRGVGTAHEGIRVDGGSDVTIEDVELVASTGQQPSGLLLFGTSGVTVTRMRSTDHIGLLSAASADVHVTDSELVRCTDALVAIDPTGDHLFERTLARASSNASVTSLEQAPTSLATVRVVGCELDGRAESGDGIGGTGLFYDGAFTALEVSDSYVHHHQRGLQTQTIGDITVDGCRFEANPLADLQVFSNVAIDAPTVTMTVADSHFLSIGRGVLTSGEHVAQLTVERCRFEAHEDAHPDGDYAAVFAIDTSSVAVRSSVFRDLVGGAVGLHRSPVATVEDCVFLGGAREAVEVLGVEGSTPPKDDAVIRRCRFVAPVQSAVESISVVGLRLEDLVITDPVSENAVVRLVSWPGPPSRVHVEDVLVHGGQASGITVAGAEGVVAGNLVLGAAGTGLQLQAFDGVASGNVVAFTRTNPVEVDGTLVERGYALSVHTGTTAELSGNTLVASARVDAVLGAGGLGDPVDVVLADSRLGSGVGHGITVQNAGAVTLTGNRIEDAAGHGVLVSLSAVEATDTDILGTRWDALHVWGDGLAAYGGADVTWTGGAVEDSARTGVLVWPASGAGGPSTLALEGTAVRRSGQGGLDLHADVKATLVGVAIEDNAHSGVIARGAEVTLTDATVTGSTTFGPWEWYGDGVHAVMDASVTCAGSTVTGHARVGVIADGSEVSLGDCEVVGAELAAVAQNGAQVTGGAAVEVVELGLEDALEVDDAP